MELQRDPHFLIRLHDIRIRNKLMAERDRKPTYIGNLYFRNPASSTTTSFDNRNFRLPYWRLPKFFIVHANKYQNISITKHCAPVDHRTSWSLSETVLGKNRTSECRTFPLTVQLQYFARLNYRTTPIVEIYTVPLSKTVLCHCRNPSFAPFRLLSKRGGGKYGLS